MAKSLADLRSERNGSPPPRPEQSVEVYLLGGRDLLNEVGGLTRERQRLLMQALRVDGDGESTGPRKMADAMPPELDEIDRRILELNDELAAYEGVLTLRATRDDGEWRRWCDQNPPRKEGEPGHDRDLEVAGFAMDDGREVLFCNADALMDDLAAYVVAWDGEPLAPGDWDSTVAVQYADKKRVASRVVFSLYEQGENVPDFRRRLSRTLAGAADSRQPGRSGSASGPSSAESPESDTSTSAQTES